MDINRGVFDKARALFIKSFLMAIILTGIVVVIDIFFAFIAPRGVWNSGNETVFLFGIWLIDAALVFCYLLSIFLISNTLGKVFSWVCISMSAIMYLVNWAVFIVVGEFLGLEGIRFVQYNFEDILWLMSQISFGYIVILICLLLSPLFFYVLYSKLKRNTQGAISTKAFNSNVVLLVAIFISVTLAGSLFWLPKKLKSQEYFYLTLRTSPQLTMFFDKHITVIPKGFDDKKQYLNIHWEKIISKKDFKLFKEKPSLPAPVIFIVVESMRSDALDDDTSMPNTYALKKDGILIKPYSASNLTDHAWPALLSSQYPLRSEHHFYYPKRLYFPRVTIYDVFKQAGFKTALFSAQNERWGGMENFIKTGTLDVYNDSNVFQAERYVPAKEDVGFSMFVKKFKAFGKTDDAKVADTAMKWMQSIGTTQFFVALNFQRPHFPYTWPADFKPPFPYCPPQKWRYARDMVPGMKNRYYNALRYTDMQIGKIISFLKGQGLYEKSTIVIMGDHGEAFYEHYSTVHGNSLFNETILTSLVIKAAEGAKPLTVNKTPELLDVAPTLCDMVGLKPHPSFQGSSWFDAHAKKKPIFITVNSPIAKQDAIIDKEWKLIKDFRSNRVRLYDLTNDPLEQKDVFSQNFELGKDLLFKLMYWRIKQLEYYTKASLRDKFYPPIFFTER